MSIVSQNGQHSAAEAFEPAAMLERIGGDIHLFAELVEIFLDECPVLVDQIRLAMVENDANRLKYALHTLRGAVGVFTVGGPYELVKQLESLAQNNSTISQKRLDAFRLAIDQLAGALKSSVRCSDSQPT